MTASILTMGDASRGFWGFWGVPMIITREEAATVSCIEVEPTPQTPQTPVC